MRKNFFKIRAVFCHIVCPDLRKPDPVAVTADGKNKFAVFIFYIKGRGTQTEKTAEFFSGKGCGTDFYAVNVPGFGKFRAFKPFFRIFSVFALINFFCKLLLIQFFCLSLKMKNQCCHMKISILQMKSKIV